MSVEELMATVPSSEDDEEDSFAEGKGVEARPTRTRLGSEWLIGVEWDGRRCG